MTRDRWFMRWYVVASARKRHGRHSDVVQCGTFTRWGAQRVKDWSGDTDLYVIRRTDWRREHVR